MGKKSNSQCWIRGLTKILLFMKRTTFFLLIGLVSSYASSYSQSAKLNLKLENGSLESLFEKIEDISDYYFFYKNDEVKLEKTVNAEVSGKTIEQVLDKVLEGTNLAYEVMDRYIVVSLKTDLLQIPGQQIEGVTGTVMDVSGEGLSGVSIIIKGTTTGTVTDRDGNFILTEIPSDATLVFSFIGYTTQEIILQGQKSVQVTLEESMQGIDEVVVVGFGTQKKANITGATASVEMDKVLGNRPVTNSAIALQGFIPGLQITSNSGEPGAQGIRLNIRGATSINGGRPLVLMDNVPVTMADVNPQDIESVTVLKDAAAASIYGARAAFGVILINTKKGGKGQALKFNYSNTFSISRPEDILEKASTYDFVHALQDWGLDAFWTGPDIDTWVNLLEDYRADPQNYPDGYKEVDGLRYALTETDLIGAFLGDDGFSQIHNFSFSGGSKKTVYRVSAGYSDEDGIIVTDNDRIKKYTVTSYLKSDLTDQLTVSTNLLYSNNYKKRPVGSYDNAIALNPFSPEDGFHEMEDGSLVPYNTPKNREKLYVVPERWQDKIRILGKVEFSPINNLTMIGEYTFQKQNTDNVTGNNQVLTVNPERFTLNPVDPARTYHQKTNSKTVYKGFNLYAKYAEDFDDHRFKVLVGHNREEEDYEYFRVRRYNLVDVNLPALGTATGIIEADDRFYSWAVMGYFGRINYNYRETYFLEMNARYDGSSRFAEGDRWGFFPSVSIGWNMAQEHFFESLEFVNQFKLRVSWGEVGNQRTTNSNGSQNYYPYVPGMPLYEAGWLNEDALQRYVSLDSLDLVSTGFTWETVRTINLGLDAKWLNSRLTTSFDIYRRETLGMLESGVDLPALLGTSAPEKNSADLQTNGWEIGLSWNDRIGDLTYNIGVTLWDNKAKITKFESETGIIDQHYVGRELGEIWGYVTDRYYTVDDFVDGSLDENLRNGTLKEGIPKPKGRTPNPGDILFKDLDNDGGIFTGNNTLEDPGDRTIIGNNSRRYQFGLFANAEYEGFDFSIMLNGVGKRDLYLNNPVRFPYTDEFKVMYTSQLDYWTPENTDAYFPRNYALGGVNYEFNRSTQTKYMLSGAYMRIKNITLGYSIPRSLLSKINVDKLRIYIAAENAADFNSWPDGINTELSNKGSGATYPYMRSYSIGLNMTF